MQCSLKCCIFTSYHYVSCCNPKRLTWGSCDNCKKLLKCGTSTQPAQQQICQIPCWVRQFDTHHRLETNAGHLSCFPWASCHLHLRWLDEYSSPLTDQMSRPQHPNQNHWVWDATSGTQKRMPGMMSCMKNLVSYLYHWWAMFQWSQLWKALW